jgi:hypothetical protein
MGQPLTPNFSAKDYSIFFLAGAIWGVHSVSVRSTEFYDIMNALY